MNLRALPRLWLPVALYRRSGNQLGRIWWISVRPAKLDGRRRRWSGLGLWTGVPPVFVTTPSINEPEGEAVTYQRSRIMLAHEILGEIYTYREAS